MTRSTLRGVLSRTYWLIGATAVIGGAWTIRHWAGSESASAKPPVAAPAKQPAGKQVAAPGAAPQNQGPPVVAVVNGQSITRDELAKECLRHYGKEVLESMTNRWLIEKHCRDSGVTVTQKEVDDEVERIAKKFNLPRDQYLKMLEKERGIKAAQYGRDIIWPTLALRKLASAKLTVTRAELDEAFESQFGPAVKARMIAVSDRKKAAQVLAEAKAKPSEFGVLARKYSEDVNSASSNGLIQPIRRHLGDPKVEDAAFALKKDQISPIIEVAENQFVILKCDDVMPAVAADHAKFDPMLTEALKDRKLRAAAAETFQNLQAEIKVENVMNDPVKSKKMPGVAATINGEPISLHELGEQCIERHGKEVLEGTITRHLLEQSLKRRKLEITDADLMDEVGRAALSMGKTLKNGEPDVEGWLKLITEQQGITEEIYIQDAVWPSVAMKKIVGDELPITEDDLRKGYEANYGPRVRCRVIVLNNQRKAQQVWDEARQEQTVEHFAKLAEQYSIEANSRSLGGEVPPIQRHGGQPVLEKEAFALRPGELSGVIQVGENFVILLCEGFTTPQKSDFNAVRDMLREDIHEKKQRLAMAEKFDDLKANATIDNYLAGTVSTPKRDKDLLEEDPLEASRPGSGKSAKRPDATARSAPKR